MRRKYSDEQKLETVLNVIEKHMSYREAAKSIGTCKSLVERWVKRYQHYGMEGLTLKNGSYDGQFKLKMIEYILA